ncbi:MAG: hypothetical protein ABI175_09065 [Polyangiales bacterium]
MNALVVAALLAAVVPRAAHADCAADAGRLRDHLVEVEPAVFRWNTAWTVALGTASILQITLAATHTNPFGEFNDDFKEAMYVGGVKSGIGALSRIVTPLRVRIPELNADACADLAAVRASVKKLANQERQNFWLTHLGGLAMNAGGGLLLWHRRSFKVGATSFLTSLPVGWLIAYTLPRRTWHLYRSESPSWTVTVGAGDDHGTIGIAGAF